MAYYWVTKSQLYTRGLGFGVNAGWPAINGDQQRVRINQWGVDNSFATDHPKDEMRFGKGGVDDAEDAEVILHELGHQIHFSASATFFATQRGGRDQRRLRRLLGGHGRRVGAPAPHARIRRASRTGTPCRTRAGPVHCLRRLDRDLMYPTDLTGAVHRDGQIWSHALWNLRTAIGATHADTAILWAPDRLDRHGHAGPRRAHRDQVDDRYGAAEAALAEAAFQERGILP